MLLNLEKPIVFFDLETTGVNVGTDHIVEICLLKVNPDQTTEQLVHRVRPVDSDGKTIHIPEFTTAIHGISDADVADKPSFTQLAPEIASFIGDADLAGYNSSKFDVPLLVEEFLRAGLKFDLKSRRLIDVTTPTPPMPTPWPPTKCSWPSWTAIRTVNILPPTAPSANPSSTTLSN